MPFVVKNITRVDPKTKAVTHEIVRQVVSADELGQDTPEQNAARMAEAKQPTVAERLDTLETKLAAIEARATK